MSDEARKAEQAEQKSVVLSRIEDMQERFSDADVASDPGLAAHREMLHCAHYSSNGSANKIEALNHTVASIAIVIAQEKLNEPARMKRMIEEVHKGLCPVTPLIGKNVDGTPNYPWPSRKEVVDFVAELRAEDVKRATEAKTLGSTLRFSLKDGISATGAVAYLTLVLAAIGCILYFWSGQRDKAIERAVSNAVSVQIRGALNSAADAGRASEAKALWDN